MKLTHATESNLKTVKLLFGNVPVTEFWLLAQIDVFHQNKTKHLLSMNLKKQKKQKKHEHLETIF